MSVESNVIIQRNSYGLVIYAHIVVEEEKQALSDFNPCAHPRFTKLLFTSKGRGGECKPGLVCV